MNNLVTDTAQRTADDFSPFRPPNEEQVFIQREAEKQRQKEAKEAASHLKIWEKKTATSRMPLRRIKDSDVLPAQGDDSCYNFNLQQRGYISAATQIAKSRVQFTRETRPQNISEFIGQKKEMFLVELAHKTIVKEIENLQEKKERTKNALQGSKMNLQDDTVKLQNFIEKDASKTEEQSKQADMKTNERKKIDADIKKLDEHLDAVKGDIDKNQDQLTNFDKSRTFLMDIYRENVPEWHAAKEEDAARKRQALEDEFVNQQGGPPQNFKSAKREREMEEKRAELRQRFAQLLADDMIDLPDDYFDENLYNADVRFITGSPEAVFTKLENKNLERIIENQETEQQLEENSRDFLLLKQETDKKVRELENNKERQGLDLVNQQLLLESLQQQSMMTSADDKKKKKSDDKDEEHEPDIQGLLGKLNDSIRNTYRVLDGSTSMEVLKGKECIDLLQDIEVVLMEFRKVIQVTYEEPGECKTKVEYEEDQRRNER